MINAVSNTSFMGMTVAPKLSGPKSQEKQENLFEAQELNLNESPEFQHMKNIFTA